MLVKLNQHDFMRIIKLFDYAPFIDPPFSMQES
jgi:hypothetical protein